MKIKNILIIAIVLLKPYFFEKRSVSNNLGVRVNKFNGNI